MTRDDIIRLAREAGDDWVHTVPHDRAFLELFATLVAAAEREACAKVCEAQIEEWVDDRPRYAASECANAIRARGEK